MARVFVDKRFGGASLGVPLKLEAVGEYRNTACLAKFLQDHRVRSLCECISKTKKALLASRVCSSPAVSRVPTLYFNDYTRRWAIEDLFNQMKNLGLARTLAAVPAGAAHWTQILSAAYALPQLLSMSCSEQIRSLHHLTPWRKKATVTAGQVRLGLRLFFGQVRVREWLEMA